MHVVKRELQCGMWPSFLNFMLTRVIIHNLAAVRMEIHCYIQKWGVGDGTFNVQKIIN